MPRKNRTFSAGDVIRINRSYLTNKESDEVERSICGGFVPDAEDIVKTTIETISQLVILFLVNRVPFFRIPIIGRKLIKGVQAVIGGQGRQLQLVFRAR